MVHRDPPMSCKIMEFNLFSQAQPNYFLLLCDRLDALFSIGGQSLFWKRWVDQDISRIWIWRIIKGSILIWGIKCRCLSLISYSLGLDICIVLILGHSPDSRVGGQWSYNADSTFLWLDPWWKVTYLTNEKSMERFLHLIMGCKLTCFYQ